MKNETSDKREKLLAEFEQAILDVNDPQLPRSAAARVQKRLNELREQILSATLPTEPTEDMIRAGVNAWIQMYPRSPLDDCRNVYINIWKAMLKASPSATRESVVEQIISDLDAEGRASVTIAWGKQDGEPTIRLWLQNWLKKSQYVGEKK